jgi:hypothetical protein
MARRGYPTEPCFNPLPWILDVEFWHKKKHRRLPAN